MVDRPTARPTARRLRIALAGATGFVGSALAERLASHAIVYALGRRHAGGASREQEDERPRIVPRRCDLFSVGQTAEALEGAEIAVYLVHSMSPNARLTQGRFEDLDLLLADNFARAAARAGVRRIVYLGGLLPPDPRRGISPHLASRFEVEKALAAHGLPVTAVRAGLVVGAEGSSLNLLVRLVERLPVMICPAWTTSPTQPIALGDVVSILERCCLDEATCGRVCEVGGPDVMSYREMMRTTARVLGRRRPMWAVPFVTPALSELWVSLVTGTSRSLVRPLIESLRHPMVVSDGWLQTRMGLVGQPFAQALEESLRRSRIFKRPIARSVQRVALPPGCGVDWLADDYPRWLERRLPRVFRVERSSERVCITLRPMRRPLLLLERRRDAEPDGRSIWLVMGGALARPAEEGEPRLEFRATPDGVSALIALQDFEPALPWWLYAVTQAPLHEAIMTAYRWSLARRGRAASPGIPA